MSVRESAQNPLAEMVGHLVVALAGDHDFQLGLEVKRLETGAATSPRSIPKSNNAFCSAFLPRCSRLITVPIGTSRISAISL